MDDIKIIFIDIDGTLLEFPKQKKPKFDKRSIKALIKAQHNGVKVVLATARPYDSVLDSKIFDLFNPDGIICTCGTLAYYNDKLIRNACFNNEIVKKILSVCDANNICAEICSKKNRYIYGNINEYVEEYFQFFENKVPKSGKYHDEDVSGLMIFAPSELDKKLKNEFPKEVMMYRFFKVGVDLHTSPAYKSQGINDILNYLNISRDFALAIGDDNSDANMFEWCKYSACMANGKELAKFKSKFICKDIKHHGVKQALKYYGVI